MLVADLRRDFVNTWFTPLENASFSAMEDIFTAMERQGRETVGRGQTLTGVAVERSADMRYVGQEHAVTVDLPVQLFRAQDRDGIKARFDAVHQTRYGFSVAAEKAEIVSLRSAIIGQMRKPTFEHIVKGGPEPETAASRGKRPVYFASTGFVDTPTYDRAALKAGNKIAGPALLEEHASTTVAHPGDQVEVDAFGDLDITVRRG
jgi:N-methylhydantoinase A